MPMRLGDVIDELTALAQQLPDGRDAEVDVGVCDGRGLAAMPDVEVTTLTRASADDGTPKATTGLLRVHSHGDHARYLPSRR